MFGIIFLIFTFFRGGVCLPPNIVIIIADDLGWNDVGFHGSNQIPTPNFDAFAYNGQILNRHYTQATCTPSRTALLTGKYPIRTGMQGDPLVATNAIALPLTEKLLPEHLKKFGYVSRMVGKWHLGFYKIEYTPTYRGFDSFLGYYNGFIRYNDSIHDMDYEWGIDARDGVKQAGDRFFRKYATDVYTEEAVNIISEHDISKPLYLHVAHAAVHACKDSLLLVRNATENDEKFRYIKDPQRRLYAGMLTAFDDSVGKIIGALHEKEMLQNSLILVLSDNGGATRDSVYINRASNWPLRGMKASLMEGGVRNAAAFWSPFTPTSKVLNGFIHITDWLPTFYTAAGGDITELGNIDGVNQWGYLTGNETSPRKNILLNIDEVKNENAVIAGEWKFVRMNTSAVTYSGETGRQEWYQYNMNEIIHGSVNCILKKYSKNKIKLNETELFEKIREISTIDSRCQSRIETVVGEDTVTPPEFCRSGCLFNIRKDPCELTDQRDREPKIAQTLQQIIQKYKTELVSQMPRVNDPNANPKYWNNYWTSWKSETQDGSVFSSFTLYIVVGLLSFSLYLIYESYK